LRYWLAGENAVHTVKARVSLALFKVQGYSVVAISSVAQSRNFSEEENVSLVLL